MSNHLSLPLSPAQKGIWLGQQKLAGNPCYNTGEMLHFEGKLDIARLIQAVAAVLDQTAALNMLFKQGSNDLEQHYHTSLTHETASKIATQSLSTTTVNINSVDDFLKAEPIDQAINTTIFQFADSEILAAWQRHWLTSTMDLSSQRPFRHAFVQQADGNYGWFLQIHHIACDGFSYALLTKQVQQAYEAGLAPDKKVTEQLLADYVALLNTAHAYETSAHCLADKDHWLKQFANHNPVSFKQNALGDSLPVAGHRESVMLAPDFLKALQQHAKIIQNDWPALLKAAIGQWFYLATGSSKVTFGCPALNRPFGPAMRLAGLQMNILPLTIDLDSQQSLIDIAKQIQAQQQNHKPHNRYRYENFASDIKNQPSAQSRATRAFGPIINILPFDRHLMFGSTLAKVTALAAGPVEDIAFYFSLHDDGTLKAFIEFHPSLYKEEECRWLCDNLAHWLNATICTASVNHPSARLIKYQPSSTLSTPRQLPAINVFAQLEHQRKYHGQKDALCWFDVTLAEPCWQVISYAALCTYIADTAQTFAQAGLHKGQKCVIAAGRGPWSIISMFACLALNAEFIGVDIDGPSSRLQTIIDDCEPRLLVINNGDWLSRNKLKMPAHSKVLTTTDIATLATRSKIVTAMAMAVFIENTDPSVAAYSIYTSGSTGQPKAVQISQQALNDFITSANSVYKITSSDRVLQFAPLHFDACIEEIFISLCYGATLSIRAKSMVENFTAFNEAIDQLGITCLDLPTAFWHEWVRYNGHNQLKPPASLRQVIIGGEACKQAAIANFFSLDHETQLINTYGPSEATVVATTKILDKQTWFKADPASIGQPLPGRSVFILDDNLNPVPKGIAGQLALAGDSLAMGYFGQSALTAEKFITKTIAGKATPLYLTGDIAAIGNFNEVIFYGRADDEIKISGQRIHPAEICYAIESVLPAYQAAVIPIQREMQYQIIAVLAHENFSQWQVYSDGHTLKAALADKLPSVQIPSIIFATHKLPLTSAGKVDRKQLTVLISEQLPQHSIQPTDMRLPASKGTAASATVKQILGVWQTVLGLSNISAQDDFFVLGGTSLQLLQVATRLAEVLQSAAQPLNITVSDLFKYPKAYELALHLDSLSQHQPSAQPNTKIFTPPQLLPQLRCKFRARNKPQSPHLLLTGATGFVGIQLLNELLAHSSQCEVTCVIRASSLAEAKSKIAAACQAQGLTDISQVQRLHIVLGDLARADWGLSLAELQRIAEPLSAIIHNGAVTSVVRDYQSLQAINVDATQTAIKLAHLAGAPLHYISTIAVAEVTNLPENYIALHDNLLDGYQQSKWASEHLLQQRAAYGQPTSLYRLPRVVGSSETGAINSKDLIWQIAAASSRAGSLPKLAIEEPWLPTNEVAHFITERVFSGTQGIYNCVPTQMVSIKSLLNEIARISGLPLTPKDSWLKELSQSSHSEDQALFTFFSRLKGQHISLPDITTEQFKKMARPSALTAPNFKAYLATAIKANIVTTYSAGINTSSHHHSLNNLESA